MAALKIFQILAPKFLEIKICTYLMTVYLHVSLIKLSHIDYSRLHNQTLIMFAYVIPCAQNSIQNMQTVYILILHIGYLSTC